jgi:ABC-type methionine transport system permease subunit
MVRFCGFDRSIGYIILLTLLLAIRLTSLVVGELNGKDNGMYQVNFGLAFS